MTTVHLDESTDAGEFLYHAIESAFLLQARADDPDRLQRVLNAICEPDPSPEVLAANMTADELQRTLSSLNQTGLSFETEVDFDSPRDEALGEAGVASAENFVRNAIRIKASRS